LNRYIKALLVAALLISLVGAVGAKNENELRKFLKSDTTEAIPITANFTDLKAAEKIKDTVKNPVRDTVEIVQDEEKLKQAIKNQVKEKANNISMPRERCGQIINARAACTQLVDKAKDYSSSGIGIPQGANNSTQENNTFIPPASNNTSSKIDAVVENFEQSEDQSPGYLRLLLNYIFR
jgi:predicted RND superfamily exporter protein